ncbi:MULTISPECIES: NHLP leader peptide family RiPP precursor [unclassified Microbacterium]|uniref:NHLP leader peptide family RiPP precursor n=1 Tax=unclassified Microbacterium TaxID=2609290 RepID=UPI000D50E75C|nr:NHLP leader peptide family RiPP precursor [Microbacterium sp. TPD7012]PVE94774.1 NHLP leader peptide family natural product precursor [Microbacterium sp. TPD7012]
MSEQNDYAKIIAKAWADDDFRARLLADPGATLLAEGVELPAGKRVVVNEDTADVINISLPARPSELSDEALDSVAGGFYYPQLSRPEDYGKLGKK